VDDEVTGKGRHSVAVRWHLSPGSAVRLREDGADVTTATTGAFAFRVDASCAFRMDAEEVPVAADFQRTTPAPVLTCQAVSPLPLRISTSWSRIPGQIRRDV